MKLVSKIATSIIIICLGIYIIGVDITVISFLYLINGNKLQLDNNYTIILPFTHWAYYKEINDYYFIMGRKIDNSYLTAEFYKNPQKINLTNLKELCKVKKIFKENTILICHKKDLKDDIIFQSRDKKVVMRGSDINASNKKVINEYLLLLRHLK